jgi:hypothetical protein
LRDDDGDDDNDSKIEEDRPYTKKEIQTMLKTATDIRVKIIVLLISFSGIRMDAGLIRYLVNEGLVKYQHLQKLPYNYKY